MSKTPQQWVEEVMSWWVKDASVTRAQAAGLIVHEFEQRVELTEKIVREEHIRLQEENKRLRKERDECLKALGEVD